MTHDFPQPIINQWKSATSIHCAKVVFQSEAPMPQIGPFSYTEKGTVISIASNPLRSLFEPENWELNNVKRQPPMLEYIIQVNDWNDQNMFYFYDAKGQFFGYIQDQELIAVDLSEQGQTLLQGNLIAALQIDSNTTSKEEE